MGLDVLGEWKLPGALWNLIVGVEASAGTEWHAQKLAKASTPGDILGDLPPCAGKP
jgi:hypothetical protein